MIDTMRAKNDTRLTLSPLAAPDSTSQVHPMEIAAPVRAKFMCALQSITAPTGCCTRGTYT